MISLYHDRELNSIAFCSIRNQELSTKSLLIRFELLVVAQRNLETDSERQETFWYITLEPYEYWEDINLYFNQSLDKKRHIELSPS